MEETETVSPALTLFVCGVKTGHECNSDGPFMSGGDNVPTLPEAEVRAKGLRGYTWGSATCSQCGQLALGGIW